VILMSSQSGKMVNSTTDGNVQFSEELTCSASGQRVTYSLLYNSTNRVCVSLEATNMTSVLELPGCTTTGKLSCISHNVSLIVVVVNN